MGLKDYYRMFGVSKNTSAGDIRRALCRLDMQCYTDCNPENTQEAKAKFKEMGGAHEVLSDAQKKWQYD